MPDQPEALPAGADHVTPYDRFAWSDTEVEQLLATGAHAADLTAFFGPEEYLDLAALARSVRARGAERAARGGRGGSGSRSGRTAAAGSPTPVPQRVLILPGIMGSQLGLPRPPPLPRDLLWLDPADIAAGRLLLLKVATTGRIRPCGVVLYSYLRLKLHLRAAGFDAAFHDYDWRLGVDELGCQLAQRLDAEPGELALVGHSMGGMVCRAALALPGAARVRRVVLLGAPNAGSFACVQALRGTYPVVRKLARLDVRNSAEHLAGAVFSSFPSLHHMLPLATQLDLLDPDAWPTSGPRPSPELLRSARTVPGLLAGADERFACVVGVGRDTVTGVTRRGDDFLYTVTRLGDGTVPVASARLAGARTYYARVAHGDLTRDAGVARAVADLLRTGSTRRLTQRWSPRSRAVGHITDRALRGTHLGKVDFGQLTPEQRRRYLESLNEPPQLTLKVPPRAAAPRKRPRAGRVRPARAPPH